MPERAAVRALQRFGHPAVLVAIAILVANDRWLKDTFPGLLTGKLSDVAGLFAFPFLATFLTALVTDRLGVLPRRTAAAAWALTAVWFAAIKTVPAAAKATAGALTTVVGPSAIVTDPTDLVALVALLPAWRLWTRAEHPRHGAPHRLQSALSLLLLSSATLATSCSPAARVVVVGFEDGGTMYAETTDNERFTSMDGRVWSPDGTALDDSSFNRGERACVRDDALVCYRLVPSEGVERAVGDDQYRSFGHVPADRRRVVNRLGDSCGEPATTAPLDVAVDDRVDGHRVLLAAGTEGVVVGTDDGGWFRAAVGNVDPTPLTGGVGAVSVEALLFAALALLLQFVMPANFWQPAALTWRPGSPAYRPERVPSRWATLPATVGGVIALIGVILGGAAGLIAGPIGALFGLLPLFLLGLVGLMIGVPMTWYRVAQVAGWHDRVPALAVMSATMAIAWPLVGFVPLWAWARGWLASYWVAVGLSLALLAGGGITVDRVVSIIRPRHR